MNQPNYQHRVGKIPTFAVQLLNTDESIATIMAIMDCEAPNRARLEGILHDGDHYPLGSWMTVCKCSLCTAEGDHITWWTEEEFAEFFEAIDNVVTPHIAKVKQLRRSLDAILQEMKMEEYSPERDIATMKIQEGIMWLGMELKALGAANPYPSSYDPTSPVVEPTADGLKL
jgi:hypothetical protein